MQATAAKQKESPIKRTIRRELQGYLDDLGSHEPSNVYRMMQDEMEPVVLEVMMRYTHGNQSKAAGYMGINRATLLTKLRRHDMK